MNLSWSYISEKYSCVVVLLLKFKLDLAIRVVQDISQKIDQPTPFYWNQKLIFRFVMMIEIFRLKDIIHLRWYQRFYHLVLCGHTNFNLHFPMMQPTKILHKFAEIFLERHTYIGNTWSFLLWIYRIVKFSIYSQKNM